MKKINNKGFSLIELLAVVIILGILMTISIAAYSSIIDGSKKDAYLDIVRLQAKAVSNLVNGGDYYAEDLNTVYYFDYRLVQDDETSKSPYADWDSAYIAVVFDGNKYTYYWTGIDKAGWRIDLKKNVEKLGRKDIYNNKGTKIVPGNSIGARDNAVIYNKDGDETERTVSNDVSLSEAKKCFKVEETNDTYSIKDYDTACGKEVDVPSSIDGKIVTIIDENAFRNKGITSVNLYYGITELKNGAFQNNNITKLKLSSSIHTIGDYAFYGNKLESVQFPEGLKTIQSWAFAYNKLTQISFSKTLTYIGSYAFYGNRLTSIELNSNPGIGGATFSNNKMSPSEAIIYKYDSKTGKTDYSTIIGYGGASKDVVIPEEVNGVKVTTIAGNAFASCGLNSVVIPESVTSIGGAAFYSNNLTTIKLPSNLKYIGGSAFRGNNITEFNIPNTVTSLSSGAFIDNKCPQGKDIIYARNSDGTTDYSTIISSCGGYRAGGKLVIPAQVNGVKLKRITGGAFQCCYYNSITLPNLSETDHLTIDTNAFYHNDVPSSSESAWMYRIRNGVVDYSTLDSYAGTRPGGTFTIPGESHGVKLKNLYASFTWSSFSTVVIPESVTSIGGGIFSKSNSNNVNLTKIVNKTGRQFNWYNLTDSYHSNPGTFATGTVSHQSGDVQITSN